MIEGQRLTGLWHVTEKNLIKTVLTIEGLFHSMPQGKGAHSKSSFQKHLACVIRLSWVAPKTASVNVSACR